MTRRICVITGSRAEYGLLYRLLKEIRDALKELLLKGILMKHFRELPVTA